jgi:hypothetical protein
MKILSYKAKRSHTNNYEGQLEIVTSGKPYTACFHAGNFCIHDGLFFNSYSIPFSSEEEFKELRFYLSPNGTPVTPVELGELEIAMREAIIEKV